MPGSRALVLLLTAATACGGSAGGLAESDAGLPDASAADAGDAGGDAGGAPQSGCNDGRVDPSRGEECDTGPGCSGRCTYLPCAPRACASGVRGSDGVCVYTPVEDGLACEDGDACTDGDHCEAGACVGTPVPAQDAEPRGLVTSFGAEPVDKWMEGVAAFVADDRLVFLESTKLSSSHLGLVRLGESGLERLDEIDSRLPYWSLTRTNLYWGEEPQTYVLPLGPERFAVVTSHPFATSAGVEVFGFAGDELESLGFTPLPTYPDGDALSLRGAVTGDHTLFLCGDVGGFSQHVQAFVLDDASASFSRVSDLVLSSGGCNELALSPDGTRLYIAALGGYRVFDVTDPAQIVPPPTGHVVLLSGYFLEDIEAGADRVVVTTSRTAGELDDAFVFDAGGTLLGALAPPPGMNGTPFGLALSGSQLFVQWFDGFRYVAAVHDLAVPGSPAVATRQFREAGYPMTAVLPSARGDTVALQPWRRVLRLQGAELAELTGPGHGSMRAILPGGVALGPDSFQRVDVADPDAPRLVAGGTSSLETGDRHQIVADPPLVLSPRPAAFHARLATRPRERFQLVDAQADPPAPLGTGYIDGPRDVAAFGVAGETLYHVAPEGLALRVRRFVASNLVGLADEPWPADLTQSLPGVNLPGFTRARIQAVGVSPAGDELLVIALRMTSEQIIRFVFAVTWVSVGPAGLTVVAEGSFTSAEFPHAVDIAFVDGHALVIGNDRLARIARDGDRIVLEASRERTGVSLYQRIVAADERRLLVVRHDWEDLPAARRHLWAVDAISPTDLTTLYSYETPDEVMSALTTGRFLTFGMNTGLLVAAPACGP